MEVEGKKKTTSEKKYKCSNSGRLNARTDFLKSKSQEANQN